MPTGVEDDYNLEVTSRLARTKLAPLYFVRSGYIYLPNTAGTFKEAGQNGSWWSSRASSTRYDGAQIPSAYFLSLDNNLTNTSAGPYIRYNGFPLRCLSTVLDM